jgi:hypothetical protein
MEITAAKQCAVVLARFEPMKEVPTEEFKRLYFDLGGRAATGWDLDYWNKFFPDNGRTDMKYRVEEPETPQHTRMMIVTDFGAREYRLFFLTEDAEDRLFGFPGED